MRWLASAALVQTPKALKWLNGLKVSHLPPVTVMVAELPDLAAFVGDFNRRYLSMDLEPILQYIINKLMRGESDDLTILSRVIQRMYGVDTVENNGVSDAQLEAYATGKQMIHEAFWTTQILLPKPTDDPANKAKSAPTDKTKSTKKSLPRLINALRDTKLAIPIWIALGQTRQGVVDKLVERQPDTPLKALGLMHDKVSPHPQMFVRSQADSTRCTTFSFSTAIYLASS